MADDFASLLAATRGQLGDAFRPRNELLDVGESAFAAKATGKPFAGFMRGSDDQASNRAMSLYSVMRGERALNLQEQGMERQNRLLQMQIERMGDEDDKWASSTALEAAKLTNDPARAYAAAIEGYTKAAQSGGKTRQEWQSAMMAALAPFGSASKFISTAPGGVLTEVSPKGETRQVVNNAGTFGGPGIQNQAARVLVANGFTEQQIAELILGKTLGSLETGLVRASPSALVGPPGGQPTPAATAPTGPNTPPGVTQVLPPKPQVLPKDTQDDFEAAVNIDTYLDAFKRGIAKTGIVQGRVEQGKAAVGLGDADFMDFQAATDNYRVAAQAIIKGIPSNFDVQTFSRTLPDPTIPENVNQVRLKFHEEAFKNMLAAKLGFYKGTRFQIPPNIIQLAAKYGINPDGVRALSAQEAASAMNAISDSAKQVQGIQDIKELNGVTYVKRNGSWFQQ